jgi:hypothetical protein
MWTGYWLAEWMDTIGIATPRDLHRALKSPTVHDTAVEMAHTAQEAGVARFEPDSARVVAGAHMDLSGIMSCNNLDCLSAEVETVFATFGHYFDSVVVEGLGPHRFYWRHRDSWNDRRIQLETHGLLLLYLRDLGADRYLIFREKPHAFCTNHYREHAKDLGLAVALDRGLGKRIVKELAQSLSIETLHQDDDTVFYFVTHGFEEGGTVFRGSAGEPPPDVNEIARTLYTNHCLAAIGDHALAREAASPLAAFADRVVQFDAARYGDVEDEAALHVRLPVLEGLGAADLIRLREDNRDHFVRFRAALAEAIREQAAAAETEAPDRIAARVVRDYVEPELSRISVDFGAARKLLAKKAAIDAGVAVVSTTIGMLTGMPLVLGTAVAASSSVVHLKKYFDKASEIELSDAYFLWRARKRHGG